MHPLRVWDDLDASTTGSLRHLDPNYKGYVNVNIDVKK